MTDEQPPAEAATAEQARSFGAVAAAYDRGRPSYSRETAAWLVGGEARTVLELGAGTGKLTEQLVALGHDVHATDPDDAMLAVLRDRVPGAKAQRASAEELPVHDRSVDVVVCAQSFHWFDHQRALPEIARVLKPGGHLALVWNRPDQRIPWVRRLSAMVGEQDQRDDLADPVVRSALFGFVEEQTFKGWQHLDRDSIVDNTLSRSNVAVLDPDARAAKVAEVLAFYDDYGRGMDGMQLPYRVSCYRAMVVDRPAPAPQAEVNEEPADGAGQADASSGGPAPEGAIVSDGTDTEMLLIDFR